MQRGFFALLGLLAVVVGGCSRPASTVTPGRDQPNVLFITLDTFRTDALLTEDALRPPSPNLDRMMAEGVLFPNFRANSGWTVPAHASLMSGRAVTSHGALDNRLVLTDEVTTLAEALAADGYDTIAYTAGPLNSGCYAGGIDQGFRLYNDRTVEQRAPCKNLIDGPREQLVVKPEIHREEKPRIVVMGMREEGATEASNAGIKALKEAGEQPLLLWLHYYDMHDPYQPPEPDAQGKRYNDWKAMPARESVAFRRWLYYRQLAYLDRQLGRVFATLEELEIMDETLIVIVGDHGENLGEEDYFGHGDFLSEEVVGTPFMLRWPEKLPGGVVVDQPVSQRDVLPTVLTLLGKGIPPGAEGFPVPLTPEGADAYRQRRPVIVSETKDGRGVLFEDPYRVAVKGLTRPPEELARIHAVDVEEVNNIDIDPHRPLEVSDWPRLDHVGAQLARWRSGFESKTGTARNDPGLEEQLRALGYVD